MTRTTRRTFLAGAASSLAAPAFAQGVDQFGYPILADQPDSVARNVSSFERIDWRDHFSDLGRATIICDTTSRALHYWDATGSDYRLYPTSVPMTDELTRRGYTEIVRKKVGPTWTPT
ncbi:MAG: L,D-transpeptidase, partial [Pseudomonadota bacterium]